jgi:glucose-1-phosphate cytidylyltransferase
MKTIILCGGFGIRIRDVADDIPKPMISVGGYPILWHVMKYYSLYNFNKFILCLGYKGQVIKDFFLHYDVITKDFTFVLGKNKPIAFHSDHAETGWEITFAETGLYSMTGARINKIAKYVSGEENFMLTYGDGIGDIDLAKLIDFHLSHKKILTLTGVRPPGRFGEIELNKRNQVTGFNEKPQVSGGRISGGFFVCRNTLFDYLEDRDNLVFEQDPMQHLVKDKELMVYKHDGFWQPMDTYRDYKLLNELMENGKAPWVKW